jgi:phage tail-like protein
MTSPAPFAMVHGLDQWRRVAHDGTALDALDDGRGVVQLAWRLDPILERKTDEPDDVLPAGLAFDPWCRLYRARPELGQVDKLLWAADGPPEPQPLFDETAAALGDFAPAETGPGPLDEPVDVAVDHRGRLFVVERGGRRLTVVDLADNRLLRRVALPATPLRVASDGERAWVLLAAESGGRPALAVLEARGPLGYRDLPQALVQPTDLVVGRDLYLLDRGGTAEARLVPLAAPEDAFEIPFATHLARMPHDEGAGDVLIVARRRGEDFLRFRLEPGAQTELPYLNARHYDGRGLVITPHGDPAYWSPRGLTRATLARVRHEPVGHLTTFRLDSGEFQTQWGRLFLDACLPRGTRVSARCLVLDDPPDTLEPLARTAPANVIGMTIHRPDLSPPMPPARLIEALDTVQTFHRRAQGNELPWQGCHDDHGFRTYEAPIIAPPGRYLWVRLELSGTSRTSPRIKSLRAEYPSHELLHRLPQVFSRDPAQADFLRRYLAIPEGLFRDLDLKASYRQLLLDPHATPAELLPWLAGFTGLVLDQRWPEAAKRTLVAQCSWLFRFRGTVAGLKRFLEIYLGGRVTLIEHFKVRGLGGALLDTDSTESSAVLGAGFRIGGRIGSEETTSITEVSIQDAIAAHAHRFSLIVAASLDDEQQAVVRHLLDTHRPAHTLYDICTLDSGMQVGRGLYAGLTSLLGAGSGFGRLQVGASTLGRTDTLGRAGPGTTLGGSRLGRDSQVG